MTTPDFREKAKELMNKCIYKPGDKLFPFAIDQMVAQALSDAVEAENRACEEVAKNFQLGLESEQGVKESIATAIAQRRGEGK